MIKDRFLRPLLEDEKAYYIKGVNFLKSATDDELKRLGLAIFCFFPPEIMKQITNCRQLNIDYSFIDDYAKEYGISIILTSKDKVMGGRLFNEVLDNPNLTAKEFLKKYEKFIDK